jgi:hypothetical protein
VAAVVLFAWLSADIVDGELSLADVFEPPSIVPITNRISKNISNEPTQLIPSNPRSIAAACSLLFSPDINVEHSLLGEASQEPAPASVFFVVLS